MANLVHIYIYILFMLYIGIYKIKSITIKPILFSLQIEIDILSMELVVISKFVMLSRKLVALSRRTWSVLNRTLYTIS